MLISGPNATQQLQLAATNLVAELDLELGDMITARVTQVDSGGKGVLRLPGGEAVTFSGGHGFTVGEQVKLAVTKLQPEINLRLVASETATAQRLGDQLGQSLARAPATFERLLQLTGMRPPPAGGSPLPHPSSLPTAPAPPLTTVATSNNSTPTGSATPAPRPQLFSSLPTNPISATGTAGGTAVMRPPPGSTSPPLTAPPTTLEQLSRPIQSGTTLRATLEQQAKTVGNRTGLEREVLRAVEESLPRLTASRLLAGDPAELTRLIHGDATERDPATTLRQLRAAGERILNTVQTQLATSRELAAQQLLPEAEAARASLHRLGDLVAMQELTNRPQTTGDGNTLLGYRVFWMAEGGFGEMAWWREPGEHPSPATGGGDSPEATTVLLALEMSQLGPIQARLTLHGEQLQIGLAAADEEALATLRARIGELRQGLQAVGAPQFSLELKHLSSEELHRIRQQSLGVAGGFSAAA